MRRPVIASAWLLALAGCGGARAATRDFAVGPFDRISNVTPFDVHVRVGSAPAVRAEGTDAALAHLRITAAGGVLAITARPGDWWENGRVQQRIEVTLPRLVGVTVAGPGDMAVDAVEADRFDARLDGPGGLSVGRLAVRELTVALNGPGDARLAGRADRATLTLHGPGDIRAADLAVRDAVVALDGPGDLSIGATGTVRGTLHGPGDLSVRGGARCAVAKRGPGDVTCR